MKDGWLRAPEDFRIAHVCEFSRAPSRAQSAGELHRCSQNSARAVTPRRIARPGADHRASQREHKAAAQPAPIVNILPREESEILLQDRFDVSRAEALADSPAMFVMHHARGLIEHLPAALPRHETQIGVFQIKRGEKFVEAAEREKLFTIESAGSSAAIQARKGNVNRGVFAVPHAQHAILP